MQDSDINENELIITIDGNNFILVYCEKYIILTQKEQYISNILLDKINLKLSYMKINNVLSQIDYIKNLIQNIIKNEKNHMNISYNDYMGIFEEKTVTKHKMNKNAIYENYLKNITLKNSCVPSNIPKELLLNDKQFYQMIINEIEKVNSNMSHSHMIVCNDDNIFDLRLRLKYKTGELSEKMTHFNKTNKYDYFELAFTPSRLYPFMPPSVEYIKPRIDINLAYSIMAMEIWELTNWNYTISLDFIITELANGLEKHFNNYLDISYLDISYQDNIFNVIELKLCNLLKRTKIQIYEKIPIDINIHSMSKLQNNSNTNTNSYWKNGTGFGSDSKKNTWNISSYIDTIKINMTETINILNYIINELETTKSETISPLLYKYIIYQFTGITLLDFNKNTDLYHTIIKLISTCIKIEKNYDFIDLLYESTIELHSDISTILSIDMDNSKTKDNIDNYIATYLFFIDMIFDIENNRKNIKKEISETIVPSNIIEEYKNIVAKEMFNYFELTDNNLYYKYHKSNISKKSMLRIITETSSLKKSLPNNWDSSILLRISKTNINIISFIITGPKDTPYHNGIFEFHAYFPDSYPSVVPQVLINTTDGGKIRFNPNLYSCGKVCLSLLGTWSGEAGESWNPDLSSFLQVLISIQSLILVDMPYFNEPGYEKNMNSSNGKTASMKYNDNIRLQTIRVAMINTIKNKIPSYENFITHHFRLKKEEILNTVNTWYEESTDQKIAIGKCIDELKGLLENL